MSNGATSKRAAKARVETVEAHRTKRDDRLLDAVVTSASLVASADGRIAAVERDQVADFLTGTGFLAAFSRDEILAAFDHRTRDLADHGSAELAVASLERFAGLSAARLIANAGEQVAAADGEITVHELHMLRLIRAALTSPPGLSRRSLR
jgi:tellurite resistance protein